MKDIRAGLERSGKSNGVLNGAWDDVYKLATFGFIEARGRGLWDHTKEFRLK